MPSPNPLQRQPGELPISPEFGLIMLAVGALIFAYIVFKLVREYRERRRAEESPTSDSESSQRTQ